MSVNEEEAQVQSERMRLLLPPRAMAIAAGILLVAGITAGCTHHLQEANAPAAIVSSDTAGGIDMLDQDWQYMQGVSRQGAALAVSATGFKIVNQDGSGGQANPPINLYGSHLEASGDFEVTAAIANNKGDASIQLYDSAPIIEDEFRLEPASVRVTETGTDVEVQIWDGSQPDDVTNPAPNPAPVYDKHFTVPTPDETLAITRSGNDLSVSAAGKILTNTNKGNVFTSGALWFGLDSSNGSFDVTKLMAYGDNLRTVDTTKTALLSTTGGLQALATKYRPGFEIGSAVALGPLVSDPAYAQEFFSNFGSLTPENAMKAEFISPKQGVYDFQAADALIAIAHKYGIQVHGHNIAFSEAEPAWMRDLPTDTAAERASTSQILMSYLTTYMTHFKGKLASMDVINEPLGTDEGPDLQPNVWSRALGPNWMAIVSDAVYKIDPNVKQYVNENGAEEPGDRQDALFNLIVGINKAGGHIYGVGLQSHIYDMSTDDIDPGDLNTTINRFAAGGLRVRISEMDVTGDNGTAAQAQQYLGVLSTCIQNTNCVGFTVWGFNDAYDWFSDDDTSLQQGNDLLFNNNRPTPAYIALQKFFSK